VAPAFDDLSFRELPPNFFLLDFFFFRRILTKFFLLRGLFFVTPVLVLFRGHCVPGVLFSSGEFAAALTFAFFPGPPLTDGQKGNWGFSQVGASPPHHTYNIIHPVNATPWFFFFFFSLPTFKETIFRRSPRTPTALSHLLRRGCVHCRAGSSYVPLFWCQSWINFFLVFRFCGQFSAPIVSTRSL